mmetsp:Transcript_13427/g.20400  ORF Transcript_13427/g.20400 Transcript_13427/m.20400 type:complete len:99 (+) Transcript_13427:74-370(+)
MYEVTSWRLLGNILAGGKFVRNTSQGKEGEGEGCFFLPLERILGKSMVGKEAFCPRHWEQEDLEPQSGSASQESNHQATDPKVGDSGAKNDWSIFEEG